MHSLTGLIYWSHGNGVLTLPVRLQSLVLLGWLTLLIFEKVRGAQMNPSCSTSLKARIHFCAITFDYLSDAHFALINKNFSSDFSSNVASAASTSKKFDAWQSRFTHTSVRHFLNLENIFSSDLFLNQTKLSLELFLSKRVIVLWSLRIVSWAVMKKPKVKTNLKMEKMKLKKKENWD